jgi:hypothetical protein
VSIDGCPRDAEEVRDLLDSTVPGVIQLVSEYALLGIEPRSPAAFAAAGASGGQTVTSVCDDELALQFGQH